MREFLARHPDASLSLAIQQVLVIAMDEAWRSPGMAKLLFDDKLSLRHTVAKRMIGQAKLGNLDPQALSQDGVAYMCNNYAARWRN